MSIIKDLVYAALGLNPGENQHEPELVATGTGKAGTKVSVANDDDPTPSQVAQQLTQKEILTVKFISQSHLKRNPYAQSAHLKSHEKEPVNRGVEIPINWYKKAGDHILVQCNVKRQGLHNWYVYAPHVQILDRSSGTPKVKETFAKAVKIPTQAPQDLLKASEASNSTGDLKVDWLNQRVNPVQWWRTCQVTSIAMIMNYHGERYNNDTWLDVTPDQLLQWVEKRYGAAAVTNHAVLSELIRSYGFHTNFVTTGTEDQMKIELSAGRPLVLAGDFPATSGHVVALTGYNPHGWLIDDPWGNVNTRYKDQNGSNVRLSLDDMRRICGPNGNYWLHFIRP